MESSEECGYEMRERGELRYERDSRGEAGSILLPRGSTCFNTREHREITLIQVEI